MEKEQELKMMDALARPFAANEVEWRAQRVGISNGRPWAMVLCYLTNRAIMNRLDAVFGFAGWRNEFVKWGDDSTLCGISCRIDGEWITKWDGASETDIEAVKGGLSDSMKRAAVQWGMGRYLYNLTENFAECSLESQKGNDWRRASTKDGKDIWWRIPTLPDWALPGDPDGGSKKNQPTTPPQRKNDGKADSVNERIENLTKYMGGLGVSREEIESAIGAKLEQFSDSDFDMIRTAAKIMKKENRPFADAMAEIA